PEALEALVARMLEKDPALRPQDGAAARRELLALGPQAPRPMDAGPQVSRPTDVGQQAPRPAGASQLAPWAAPAERRSSLTSSEQRLLCVVLWRVAAPAPFLGEEARTLELAEP